MLTFKQYRQLNEGPLWDATKQSLKDNAKYLPVAIPAPGGLPALTAKTAYDIYKNYKKKKTKKKVATA